MRDTRVAVLTEIARLYSELVDPATGPYGIAGSGDRLPLMPATYTATVREYERLVKLMRDDRHEPLLEGKLSVRSAWWHLEHYHHRAQRTIRHDPVTAKAGGKLHQLRNQDGTPLTRPRIAYLRDPKADERKADRALEWIAERWDHKRIGEPMLPAAVVEGFKVAA